MRILITGANGFIGRHTVSQACAGGHDVLWWGNQRSAWPPRLDEVQRLNFSIGNADAVRQLKGIEAVIHLAGRYPLFGVEQPSPIDLFESNATLTASLLDACARAGVHRFVLASTAQVYGIAQILPIVESQPLRGRTPYAASKICAEALLRAYASKGMRNAISLRMFNVYGPGQPARNVMATICNQALQSGPVIVYDDRPIRDFVYVADVARALVAAATCATPPPDAVNIGSSQGTSIKKLGELIMRAVGRPDHLRAMDRPGTDAGMPITADIRLAEHALDWRPTTTLEQGIAATIDALRHTTSSH